VIKVRGLEKRYGAKRVLSDLSFDVARGSTLVVVGPNGAGKTTLLRVLAGLAAPTRGTVEVALPRGRLGYLGHEPLLYRQLSALENLDLYGRLYRLPERRERAGMLLERYGLWAVRNERVAAYSRGMVQRLALCRTLLHDPDLLILDEPYAALDAQTADLLDAELGEDDARRSIVVATHDPGRLAGLRAVRLQLA
jgi:heme exporter protein A